MSVTDTRPAPNEAMPGLRGKGVLVTGGTSGIGQAIAVRFAQHGANVAINYLARPMRPATPSSRSDVRGPGGPGGSPGRARSGGRLPRGRRGQDGRRGRQRARRPRRADQQRRDPDLAPQHELSSDDFEKVLGVNLRGAFLCAREAIRHFLDEGKPGVIVNVSSVHQLIPKPDYLGYSVSKGGMQNLTRTLALEYAGRGIRVNANRARGDRDADQPGMDRRSGQARAGGEPHSDDASRNRGRDGWRRVLPGERRRRIHHRSDDLRGRWADAVPELPRAVVLGMSLDTVHEHGRARADRRRQARSGAEGGHSRPDV